MVQEPQIKPGVGDYFTALSPFIFVVGGGVLLFLAVTGGDFHFDPLRIPAFGGVARAIMGGLGTVLLVKGAEAGYRTMSLKGALLLLSMVVVEFAIFYPDVYREHHTNAEFNRARAALVAADSLSLAGNDSAAQALYISARSFYRREKSPVGMGAVQYGLGQLAMNAGRLDSAEALFRDAHARYEEGGWTEGEAHAALELAEIAHRSEKSDSARARFHEAVSLFQAAGDHEGEVAARMLLGDLECAGEHLEECEQSYTRALSISLATGNVREQIDIRLYLGQLQCHRGETEEGRSTLQVALRLAKETRYLPAQANALLRLGQVEAPVAPDLARQYLTDSARIFSDLGSKEGEKEAREELDKLHR